MFKIGQKVVCIKDGQWKIVIEGTLPDFGDPKKHEIVTVSEQKTLPTGQHGLSFYEYPNNFYTSHHFRPLSETSIEEVIENMNVDERNLVLINK